jgi:hypothetical protein
VEQAGRSGEEPGMRHTRRITNLLMKIKQGARTQKNVKNEGCSQDLIEKNIGREYTNCHNANIFVKINSLSFRSIC